MDNSNLFGASADNDLLDLLLGLNNNRRSNLRTQQDFTGRFDNTTPGNTDMNSFQSQVHGNMDTDSVTTRNCNDSGIDPSALGFAPPPRAMSNSTYQVQHQVGMFNMQHSEPAPNLTGFDPFREAESLHVHMRHHRSLGVSYRRLYQSSSAQQQPATSPTSIQPTYQMTTPPLPPRQAPHAQLRSTNPPEVAAMRLSMSASPLASESDADNVTARGEALTPGAAETLERPTFRKRIRGPRTSRSAQVEGQASRRDGRFRRSTVSELSEGAGLQSTSKETGAQSVASAQAGPEEDNSSLFTMFQVPNASNVAEQFMKNFDQELARLPLENDDFETTMEPENKYRIAKRLYSALLADPESDPRPQWTAQKKAFYKDSQKTSKNDLIEAMTTDLGKQKAMANCIRVVQQIEDIHRFLVPTSHLDKSHPKGQAGTDKKLTCSQRCEKVIEAVRQNKQVAQEIIAFQKGKTIHLARDPVKFLAGKLSNTGNNCIKQEQLEKKQRKEQAVAASASGNGSESEASSVYLLSMESDVVVGAQPNEEVSMQAPALGKRGGKKRRNEELDKGEEDADEQPAAHDDKHRKSSQGTLRRFREMKSQKKTRKSSKVIFPNEAGPQTAPDSAMSPCTGLLENYPDVDMEGIPDTNFEMFEVGQGQ